MRASITAALGICLCVPGLVQAQATTATPSAAKPQTPPAATAPPAAKPQTPTAERKEVTVPEKVLQTYVGDYDLGQGRVLQFAFEKGSLWGGPVGDDKSQLFATSPTRFFLKNIPIEITFNKDAKGTVTGLTMEREGRPAQEGKKVK
jgi:hypothetical protein